jgi:hypothetical protein
MTSNEPWSEQWRLAASEWVDADAAARLLEETKSAVFAQMVLGQGDNIAVNRAENNVKGSPEWADHIRKIVEAKTHANKLRVKADYIKMRYWEEQGANASKRAEMRL